MESGIRRIPIPWFSPTAESGSALKGTKVASVLRHDDSTVKRASYLSCHLADPERHRVVE